MLDINKPVRTRDGRPAKIISTNLASSYKLGALVTNEDGTESFDCYDIRGRAYASEETPGDLINVPETTEAFINVYIAPLRTSGFELSPIQCASIAEATRKRPTGRTSLGYLKLTAEDGNLAKAEFIPA